MNNYFKNIIFKLITIIVGIVLFASTLIHVSYLHRGYTKLNGFYYLKKNSIDLAVIGTSTTLTSFLPLDAFNDYGISAYNYTTNAHFENTIKYSIIDIKRTQNPTAFLIDLTPFIFEHYAGNESWPSDQKELYIKYNLDSRKYHFDRLKIINEILIDKNESKNINDYLYYFFDIARYHTNKINIDNFNNSAKNFSRGFEHFRHIAKHGYIDIDKVVFSDKKTERINEREEFYLDELIRMAKQKDNNIVFYCPPVLFYDKKYLRRKNYIIEYLKNNSVNYIDLHEKYDDIHMIHYMDFWDDLHFDALGAEKITKTLCEYIKNNYAIPDRRKESAYEDQIEDCKEWENIKGEYVFLDLTSAAVDIRDGKVKKKITEENTENTESIESIDKLIEIASKSNIKKSTSKNKNTKTNTKNNNKDKNIDNNTSSNTHEENTSNIINSIGRNVITDSIDNDELQGESRIYSFKRPTGPDEQNKKD